jgi:hypothetical protein
MLVVAVVLLVPQVALAALVVAVLVEVLLHKMQLMEQQIQVVAVEATTEFQGLLKQAALVLLFFLFQLFIILEQPLAHQQLPLLAQIQF